MSAIERLRADAAELLTSGRAKMILGYRRRGDRVIPAFITEASEAEGLVYDETCRQNLAAYLRKSEIRQAMPVAVVAPPATMRSLVVLAAESQLVSEKVLVLALDAQEYHGVLDLAATAELLRAKYASLGPDESLLKQVAELAAMTPAQRATFWTEQFARCTRCYACRAACPGCYCERCIVEKNRPQWISSAAAEHGNFAWGIIRAFHQTGRCTLCGSCEAACPQSIPLMLLNVKIDQDVESEFDAKPGYDLAGKPVIGTWKSDDDDSFMK